jgi:dTDP-glucose 4,6-dehydratase
MNLLSCDLEYIKDQTTELWQEAQGKRFFITGGSGFFGRWIVESFCAVNRLLKLDASAVVLTRKPERLMNAAPHLASDPSIKLMHGDVRSFSFGVDRYDYVVHAASEGGIPAREMLDTIVQGTRHTLDFASACGATNFLLLSSGAVYGAQPPSIEFLDESFEGAPILENCHAPYGEGKRMAELLCHIYSRDFGINCKVARCFTFVGAHLPLDSHFAIGNFIGNALRGEPLQIQGDGTPLRSYLYMADAVVWIWTMLFRASTLRPYNLGSDQPISIADLAQTVAEVLSPGAEIIVAQRPLPDVSPLRYVPSVRSAKEDLGLTIGVDLREAIRRTAAWCKGQDSGGDKS